MDIGTMIPILIVLIAVFFVVSKLNLGPKIKCNRCDGTGDVDERWPDPKEESGWHEMSGQCPKCKGKGKISARAS